MMLILRDDLVIETFDSGTTPPKGLEAIDIANEEYQFCDDQGQRYVGVLTKPIGTFSAGSFVLEPTGNPDEKNLKEMLSKATGVDARDRFKSLDELQKHLTKRFT